ncbi:MAG: YqhR family membrane protein [Bacillus sp. (in: firmicutes)]
MTENQVNDKKKLDQNKQEQSISQGANVALTGFIGGVFWSALGELAYYFSFTDVGPRSLLSGWLSNRWKEGAVGFFIAVLLCGLLSIIVSYVYYWTLRKTSSLLICIVFGVCLWLLVHLVFSSFLPSMLSIGEMNANTIVTTICLYILYGVFIGISISFDESERKRLREQKLMTQQQS